jgi:hypothetical protein
MNEGASCRSMPLVLWAAVHNIVGSRMMPAPYTEIATIGRV